MVVMYRIMEHRFRTIILIYRDRRKKINQNYLRYRVAKG